MDLYELYPFHKHPLWRRVFDGSLTKEQVVRAEIQHCLRTKAGKTLRENAVHMARRVSEKIWEQILETYLEECTNNDKTGPSHLELIERFVMNVGGMTRDAIHANANTPGNAAAIALYRDIAERGAGCHLLGAGAVELYYCDLSGKIFKSYTKIYGISAIDAHTYELHGPMDKTHAERAFAVLDEAVEIHGWDQIYQSVRDAFVATSLHYDGMLQAAVPSAGYWNGRS